ncbi:MAG TPA: hypothetical protein PLL30_17160 [Candidatus Krumholzibacteria bacterium]|nr:hypothetical protein [Candidatus Krumholzibacteria bacterium]HPD73505.1 hypothetical protein [Candidatus Krumholzibacteria bacterium]HRY42291.1 hypothetical protein [Candidatus Krumholzibacteria bacterium]
MIASLFIALALAAADRTPPVIIAAEVAIEYTANGGPATVEVVGGRYSEPCLKELTVEYQSTYPRYGDGDVLWQYRTASVGTRRVKTSAPYQRPSFTIGRAYHSDRLVVVLKALDVTGNWSLPDTLFNGAIDMPIGPAAPVYAPTTGLSAFQSGGMTPATGSLDEWAETEVAILPASVLYGHATIGDEYTGWARQVRAVPGSHNVAVLGFIGCGNLWENRDLPMALRCYRHFISLFGQDSEMLARDVGGVPVTVDQVAGIEPVGSRLVNILHAPARREYARFLVNEWNHSESRVASSGFLFDVFEYTSETALDYGGVSTYAADHIDRDRDGVPLARDLDEQRATRKARLDLLELLRAEAGVESFLLGANSVSARSDADAMRRLDAVLVECMQCPGGCGNGLDSLPWHNAYGPGFVQRQFGPDNLLAAAHDVPSPPTFSSSWGNLAASMRQAVGPFILPEAQSVANDAAPADPTILEAFSLLFGHVYPVYIRDNDPWRRQWSHPARLGLADLHDLGEPTGHAVDFWIGDTWNIGREYDHGDVVVQLPARQAFDCGQDGLEYRVTVNGRERRVSEHFVPQIHQPTKGVALVDSCGLALADAAPLQVVMRLVELGVTSWGCESAGLVRATWSPPTTGSPVVRYVIELEIAGDWPDTTVLIPLPTWAGRLRQRVGGVDAEVRQGPWSEWGDWYEVED